jgi:nucleoside-diphosphate-sugar epimerase
VVRRFSQAGWDVREIVRRDVELNGEMASFANADVVVHAAAATRAPSVAQLRDSNVRLTERMLVAARAAGVRRFVFLSSLAAVGPAQSRDAPVTEETPPMPIEAYGRSKLDAERLVAAATDLQPVIIRPAAVYGPGDRDFLNLFRVARHGVALHPANRDHWLSIINVVDLADAIVRAASASNAAGRVYCLANDEPVQWAELFRLAAKCATRELRIDIEIPELLVDIGARVGDLVAHATGRAGLLTTEKVVLNKGRFWTCSNERAVRELELSTFIPLQRGLCDTYHWYLDRGWL